MFVIGTAGHVDHGKSALVHALTGIDPDRLREEKERGMTIDLGFAWLALPSGREVSIVDVPGHERFIRNMLAGVGGIDLALLVIAADEGVMPQTREHLAILDLLGIGRGVVAVTKRDLAEDEWLELVVAEVEETLQPTVMAGSPIVAVSAVTRQGLDELVAAIDARLAATPPKPDLGRPRLAIDRIFTLSGFGTVVTGTLIDGSLALGQEVEVVPAGLRSRIRGLQTHRQRIERAAPGSRVAINLVGVSTDELSRGDVVASVGWLKPSQAADARLRLLASAPRPLAHNAIVAFHCGTAEAEARVRLLDRDELAPGDAAWAQLRFDRPVAVVRGDGFIIRSTEDTIGGGRIVQTQARRHRRFAASTLATLAMLEQGASAAIVAAALDEGVPLDMSSLAQRTGLPPDELRSALAALADAGELIGLSGERLSANSLVITPGGWAALAQRGQTALADYHRQYPLRSGMPKEELRQRLRLAARAFGLALDRLATEGSVVAETAAVRLPLHRVSFDAAQQAVADGFVRALSRESYAPPTDSLPDAEVLAALQDLGRIVKVAEGVYFDASAYRTMVERIVAHLNAQETITVAQVRDLFDTSRKYALAIMEHLDEQKVTRRIGDMRRLRQPT